MKTLRMPVVASILSMITLHAVAASAAIDAFIKVVGTKQGQFKGNSTRDSFGEIVTSFSHGPTKPRDYNAATAAGKQLHEPIVVTVKADAATKGQWTTASASREPLTSVTLSVFKQATTGAGTGVAGAGEEKPYYTVKLTNAQIEKIEMVTRDPTDTSPAKPDEAWLRVSLTFQKIETTWNNGGITAQDDWLAPQ